ncbi:hypothetical protein GGR57DRAFT_486750 [Xylariaceae sp. FL1272]|nr:hypothetical protein GGR57DRAFT_486750 [Xylariaceae sp. FL1272]
MPGAEGSSLRTVKAKKMAILSCGVFGNPAVLERSGIGSQEILTKAGVEPIVTDVPGVGEGFNDHHMVLYPYKSSLEPRETIDGVQSGRMNIEHFMSAKADVMGWNAQNVHGKVRPTEEEVARLSPSSGTPGNEISAIALATPVAVICPVGGYPVDPTKLAPIQYLGIAVFTLNLYSRGHVHITGPSINDPLDIESRLLTDPKGCDLEMQKWAYKRQREIARRMAIFRSELPLGGSRHSPRGPKPRLWGSTNPRASMGRCHKILYATSSIRPRTTPCWRSGCVRTLDWPGTPLARAGWHPSGRWGLSTRNLGSMARKVDDCRSERRAGFCFGKPHEHGLCHWGESRGYLLGPVGCRIPVKEHGNIIS